MNASRTMKLAEYFASFAEARRNCEVSGNSEWFAKHTERATILARDYMPRGSGFDNGTQFDIERSSDTLLVFNTSYHHMNETGYYDGWSEHTVRVKATFTGFDITVNGRDRNGIKDMIAEYFYAALSERITETAEGFSRA